MDKVLFCDHCGAFRKLKRIADEIVKCSHCTERVAIGSISEKLEGKTQVVEIERSELLLRLFGHERDTSAADEAVIDDECPKCSHGQLSFHTAQLRGVDEGQTIFYSCLNEACGHKFTVNS